MKTIKEIKNIKFRLLKIEKNKVHFFQGMNLDDGAINIKFIKEFLPRFNKISQKKINEYLDKEALK